MKMGYKPRIADRIFLDFRLAPLYTLENNT